MVDGQLNKIKIGVIIQARMKSTRLPGKVLLPLPFENGKPLLKWIIDELDKSSLFKDIIIATSTNRENDQIENFANNLDTAEVFRGKEEDVLSRFIEIIKKRDYDHIVRLTGDNPFLDVELLNKTIENHLENRSDYTNTTDLPVGMNFEIISSQALLSSTNTVLTKKEKEHVTLHIKNNKKFKTSSLSLIGTDDFNELRLTVDYPSDFALASLLFDILTKDENPGIKFIKRVKKSYPWLFDINKNNSQVII